MDSIKQKRKRPQPSFTAPAVQEKLNRSRMEAKALALREIRCPCCGFLVAKVYSDMTGHYLARCRKCKRELPINLAYFRKQKGIWRLKLKYYGIDFLEK